MKIVLGTMTFSDQVDQDVAENMVRAFKQADHTELDTAFVYNQGKTEGLLGELNKQGSLDGLLVAGKANPSVGNGLTPESVTLQLNTSLERLNASSLDLFYLHAPDLSVPIIDTLSCVAQLHSQGKFKRFGLSNYASWQVAEIVEICRIEGWLVPTVYQGMYNALTRDVERELFPCLENYGIAFYSYNPLAGGLLSGKHFSVDTLPTDGRFANFNGYQDRYWKAEYFSVVNSVSSQCRAEGIEPAAAALRWLVHHSLLAQSQVNNTNNITGIEHAIIVGASSMTQFELNITALTQGPLPAALVAAFDNGWEQVRAACIKYFRP